MKNALLVMLAVLLQSGLLSAQDKGLPSPEQPPSVRSINLPDIKVDLKEGEGMSKAATYCNICHSTDYITMQPKFTRAQWTGTVTKMVKTFGAPIGQEDADKIINYLTVAYGTGK